jgi:hypothetical protein
VIARLQCQLFASLVNQVSDTLSGKMTDFSLGDLVSGGLSHSGLPGDSQAAPPALASLDNRVIGSLFHEQQDFCLGTPVSGGLLLSRLPIDIEAAPPAVCLSR